MILKQFYSYNYWYFRYKRNENEALAWYLTIGFIGFVFCFNFMAAFCLIFGYLQIDIMNPNIRFYFLWFFPWFLHFFFLAPNRKNKIKKLRIKQGSVPTIWKVSFWIYFVFSWIIFITSIVYYSTAVTIAD